jgi:response regulator RpfG family c-di-GMP phosphodiesterase
VASDRDSIDILVVDDEQPVREALKRVLTKLGHTVRTTDSGEDALELIRGGHPPEILLLDVRMPGIDGSDVVVEALSEDPEIGILMLSGMDDATTAAICLQRGAMDYLTKPIEMRELNAAIGRAMRRRQAERNSRQSSNRLRVQIAEASQELEVERTKLRCVTVATLEALVNALEAKDPYLAGHSTRVAALSATIAAEMDLSDDVVDQIRTAGRLHDLGKIGIRESVLNKEDSLTDEEFEHVKQHVVIGSQILAPLTHLGAVIDYVRGHHERWDGNGYPDGLSGEDIPIGARIIGAAEIYDALTTARAYQTELSPSEAVDRMQFLTGSVIDPQVMDALSAAVDRRQTLVFIEGE